MSDIKQYEQQNLPLNFYGSPKENIAHTIEIFDIIPLYYYKGVSEADRKNGLQPIKRKFVHEGNELTVTIIPAKILDENEETASDYYPGLAEELVEFALRKIATKQNSGVIMTNGNTSKAGVVFSIYELRKELKATGHTYSIAQIKKSLDILQNTNIILTFADGTSVFKSHILTDLGLRTAKEWKDQGKGVRCFACFNSLVTTHILSGKFREIDYVSCMSYKSSLARYLHKRLNLRFINASFKNSYHFLMSTIIRDSGTTEYKRTRDNLKKIRTALDELKDSEVISRYTEELIKEGRKTIDAKYVLYSHIKFSSHQKKINSLKKLK